MSKGKHTHAYDPIVFSHLCVLMKKLRNCLDKCVTGNLALWKQRRKGGDQSPRKSRKAELNQAT